MNSQSGKKKRHHKGEGQHTQSVEMNPPHDVASTNPAQSKTEQRKGEAYWERRQFNVQRMIAVAGVFGIVIYGFQLWEMRKSTDAATKAANVAEDSVRFSKENARLDQRAWVTVSTTALSKELVAGEIPEVKIMFVNSGRTPARDVTIYGVVFVAPEPEPRLPSQEPAGTKSLVSKMVLGPNNTKESRIRGLAAIDQKSIDAIGWGDTRLIVQGVVNYVDVFDAPHETFFAFDYRMNAGLLLSGCKTGNDVK